MDSTVVNDAPATDTRRSLRLGRTAEILLGFVLIISGILKAADINVFIVRLSRYGLPGVFMPAYVGILAMATELFLGALLLMGTRRRRVALFLTTLMLLVYTGAIAFAWIRFGIDDCGCIGFVKMSPFVGIVKNLVLLALCVVAWRGVARRTQPQRWYARLAWVGLRTAIALSVALGPSFYAHAHIEPVQPEILGRRPFAGMTVATADGQTLDLGQGDYMVFLLGTTCAHCREAVPEVNEWHRSDDFPTVVGLCSGPESRLERFKQRAKPEFPIQMIGLRTYQNLLGLVIPRYVLIRDGEIVHIWDGTRPSVETVQELLRAPLPTPDTPSSVL